MANAMKPEKLQNPGLSGGAQPHQFGEFCSEDIHAAFGLSYASYCVLRRSLMQEMPPEWQHAFTGLVAQFHEVFPRGDAEFTVHLRDEATHRFARDPLARYRYPDRHAIAVARSRQLGMDEA